jgi:hypothetical protein
MLQMKEEYGLSVFQNAMLRRILGLEMYEVT